MSLTEIDVDGSADVTKYNFKCDDVIDENIPNPLPGKEEGWFRMAIIGKSGSGKTNLVRCLTEKGGKNQMYYRRFTNVFYVCPSIKSMDKKPKLNEDNFYSSLNDLPTIIKRIKEEDEKDGRTLIIIDDCSHELKKDANEDIKKLFQNNRHLGRPLLDEEGNQLESGSVSVIIIAQRLNNLPRQIRSQITHWCLFDPRHTKSELQTIFDELIHCDKTIFNKILDLTYKTPFNFMFIDTNKSKIYNGFKKEFIIHQNNYL